MKKQYTDKRPALTADTKRIIEVGAGHKCTVKNCNEHTYLEIHHINQDREDNNTDNLILLCDKHHKMAHANKIDRKSLKEYKKLSNNSDINEIKYLNNFISIELDNEYNLIDKGDNLISLVQDIIFQSRTQNDINIKYFKSKNEDDIKELNTLQENDNLTIQEKEKRNLLLTITQSKYERLDHISQSTQLLFYGITKNYHFNKFGTNEAITTLKGLLDSYKNYQGRTKIDVWREKPFDLSAPIFITDKEIKLLELHPEIENIEKLMFNGFYTYDLPSEIIMEKVLPAIAKEILYQINKNKNKNKKDQILKEFSPLTWKIGLG